MICSDALSSKHPGLRPLTDEWHWMKSRRAPRTKCAAPSTACAIVPISPAMDPVSSGGAGGRRRAFLAAGRQRAVRVGIRSGRSISGRPRPARRQDPGASAPDRRNRAQRTGRGSRLAAEGAAQRGRVGPAGQRDAAGAELRTRCHCRAVQPLFPGARAALRAAPAPQQSAGICARSARAYSPSSPTASKSTWPTSPPAWSRNSRGQGAPNWCGMRAPARTPPPGSIASKS